MSKVFAVCLALALFFSVFYVVKHNEKNALEVTGNDSSSTAETADPIGSEKTPETTAATKETAETKTETVVVYTTVLSDMVFEAATTTTAASDKDYVYRGALVSMDGVVLWYTDGNVRRANPEYDLCVSNLLSKKSALKLDTVLNDLLRQKNLTEVRASTGNPLGQSVRLTLSAEKQKKVFDYLKQEGLRAAVCLIDDDGGLEVAASTPGFSNDVAVTSGSSSYYNNVFRLIPLGSVAKMSSGVVLAFNHVLQMDDPGEDKELGITNWDYSSNRNYPIKDETLVTAFVRSSNYFFGKAFADLGAECVKTPLDMFFSYNTPITCDFGVLERKADLENTVKRAHAAFGQRSRTTLLSTCADARAVVTGEMVTPYVVSGLLDTKTGQTLKQLGKKTLVPNTTPIPEEYRADVKEGMKRLAGSSGFAVDGYNVYAKTGTAASEGLWADDIMSTVVVVEDPETGTARTMMLTVFNGSEHGYQYASDTKGHVKALLSMLF